MKHPQTILVSIILILLLPACGGDNPTTSTSRGAGPPPQTAFQERTDRILALNPTLLASDTLAVTFGLGGGVPTRLAPATCRANQCTHPLVEGPFPFAYLLDSEGYGEPVAYRGVERVILGGAHTVEPETDEYYSSEFLSMGAWLDESAFFVEVAVFEGYALTTRYLHSYSLGRTSRTNPIVGNATWRGVMLGTETEQGSNVGARYDGNATVTVALVDATATVRFDNIANSETYAPYPDMAWNDVPLAGGTFRRDTREVVGTFVERLEGSLIEGRFYGSTHREVGGIFETPEMLGAFGARR